jgi:hypothetical protein
LALLGPPLLLVWVAGVVAFYYALHKPLNPQGLQALGIASANLLIAGSLTCLAGGLGRRVSGALEQLSALERLALQAGLGWGLMALLALAAGLLGGLWPWAAWLGLAAGLLLLRRQIRAWMLDLRQGLQQAHPASRLEWLSLAFVLFSLGLVFLQALAPPTKWDSLAYHLELPRQYLAHGRIFFFPENLHSGFPQTVEMLYTWAMAASSPAAALIGRAAPNPASLLCWMAGVLMLLGLEGFARRVTSRGAGWLAPAALLAGSSLAQSLHWAYVDIWLALFGLGMLVSLEAYWRSGKPALLVWAGMAAGFALGSKTTAGSVMLAGALLLLPFWPAPGAAKKSWLLRSLLFFSAAVLAASPWYLKNWWMAGSPFYPLFAAGGPPNPWMQTFGSLATSGRSLLDDLLLPLEATLLSVEGARVPGQPEYDASLGPLLLALCAGLPFGWSGFFPEQKRMLGRLLAAALAGWVLWAAAAHYAVESTYARHYFGFFPAWAVLAAAGYTSASRLRWGAVRLRRILAALTGLALGLAALGGLAVFTSQNPLPVVLGQQTPDDYLVQRLGMAAYAMQAVEQTPPEARLLLLWEPRAYYCPRQCFADLRLSNWRLLVAQAEASGAALPEAPAAVAAALRQKGITHLLVHEAGRSWIESQPGSEAHALQTWQAFRQDYLSLVASLGESYALYALAEAGE